MTDDHAVTLAEALRLLPVAAAVHAADGSLIAASAGYGAADAPALRRTALPGGGWLTCAAMDATDVDDLTGLPGRARLRAALAAAMAGTDGFALLMIDLDRFKAVNDTLGHPVGDRLLRRAADRLRKAVGEGDLVVRLGGDEFAVLLPDAGGADRAPGLAARIVDLVGRSYLVDEHLVNVGVSVGLVTGEPGGDPDVVIRRADLALYRAKAEGRGRVRVFEPSMDAAARARRDLEMELRRALALRQFSLHYQPQASLTDDRLVGFEALIRWNHPTRGMVSPAAFIPIAEETGLIGAIGEWVLRTACLEASRWPDHLRVAVNLSPLQFDDPALPATVASALAVSGLRPERLELEITEGVLIADSDAALSLLRQLKALGLRIAMDDFGTGYSSLSYLRQFPFDKVKIDRSFVSDMETDPDSAAIVRAVLALGTSLGMTTTAEGVESWGQLEALRAQGCGDVQGYLLSPPVPADGVARFIGAGPDSWSRKNAESAG